MQIIHVRAKDNTIKFVLMAADLICCYVKFFFQLQAHFSTFANLRKLFSFEKKHWKKCNIPFSLPQNITWKFSPRKSYFRNFSRFYIITRSWLCSHDILHLFFLFGDFHSLVHRRLLLFYLFIVCCLKNTKNVCWSSDKCSVLPNYIFRQNYSTTMHKYHKSWDNAVRFFCLILISSWNENLAKLNPNLFLSCYRYLWFDRLNDTQYLNDCQKSTAWRSSSCNFSLEIF